MPEKSVTAVAAAAPSAAAPLSPASAAIAAAAAGSSKNRLVHRKIYGDVFGLATSLYASSPAVLKYGVDHFIALSRPVVEKVNPLALRAVALADDGVDYVQSKLAVANTSAAAAGADLKDQLQLVSAQWFARVDAVLVPLHPTLAANVYVTQAVEQFKALFAAAKSGDDKQSETNAAAAAPTLAVFIAKLKDSCALLWDERLVPLSEAFFTAARARYNSSARSADEALISIRQHLGTAWNQQLAAVYASRVGSPARDIYARAIAKFVQLTDSKQSEVKTGQQFVQAMKGTLGHLWTDSLAAPILELYAATKKQAEANAASVRALAASANRESVSAQYTSLVSALSGHVRAGVASASATAEELSHWSVRRLYRSGTALVSTAVDNSTQKALKLSAQTLDYVLPAAGEDTSAGAGNASGGAAADQKSEVAAAFVAPTAADANRLTLRVLRDRASSRVRARVSRAVAAGKSAGAVVVTRSDALASATSGQLSTYIGVNAYAEAKELLARTQTLLTALQSDSRTYVADTSAQVSKDVTAIREYQLKRVRTALAGLHTEFEKHRATVTALVSRLESKTGVSIDGVTASASGVRARAVTAIRLRLSAAVTRLSELAANAQAASDYVLDRELAAFPQDLLRAVRIIPTLLPAAVTTTVSAVPPQLQSARAAATARLRSLAAVIIEVVQSVAAYAHIKRTTAAPAPTPAAASAAGDASLSITPSDSPKLAPAPTPAPTATAAAAASPAPAGVKQLAASYAAIAAASAAGNTKSKQTPTKATAAAAAPADAADDADADAADEGEAEDGDAEPADE